MKILMCEGLALGFVKRFTNDALPADFFNNRGIQVGGTLGPTASCPPGFSEPRLPRIFLKPCLPL